jgi:CheY-like chemotaxis protein
MGDARILVAEDDFHTAETLGDHLGRTGAEVVVVGDGQAAIEQAAAGRFDIVVTDYNMPLRNGVEVATELRRMPAYVDSKIILFTGNGRSQFKTQLEELSVTYFNKAQLPELIEHVQALVDGLA